MLAYQGENDLQGRIPLSVLNVIEQAVLKSTGQYHRREEFPRMNDGNYADVDVTPYNDIHDMAMELGTKSKSTAYGGERFVECTLYKNSEYAKEQQRKEDARRAAELLTIRNSLERRNNNNDRSTTTDNDRSTCTNNNCSTCTFYYKIYIGTCTNISTCTNSNFTNGISSRISYSGNATKISSIWSARA